MNIRPCNARNSYIKNGQRFCIINDDMKPLYEKLESCNAMVIANPIYWFTITAQLKLFMDRLYGLNARKTGNMAGKKTAIVLAYGDIDPYISGAINAIYTLRDSFAYLRADISGMIYGQDFEEARSEQLLEKAKQLGTELLYF